MPEPRGHSVIGVACLSQQPVGDREEQRPQRDEPGDTDVVDQHVSTVWLDPRLPRHRSTNSEAPQLSASSTPSDRPLRKGGSAVMPTPGPGLWFAHQPTSFVPETR